MPFLLNPHTPHFFKNAPLEVRRELYREAPRAALAVTFVIVTMLVAAWWFTTGRP